MNKYRAKKQTRIVAGQAYVFPRKAEAERFDYLVSLAKKKKIQNLSTQPEFIIAGAYNVGTTKTKSGISKVARMKYTPDFKYERDGLENFKYGIESMAKQLEFDGHNYLDSVELL